MKYMNMFLGDMVGLIAVITWLMGIVLAKGFWMTALSIIPFYAWYLVVEKIMVTTGFIG